MANNIVDRFIDSTDSSQYASTFITATASIDSNITNSTETSFALNSATIDLLHHIIINSQQSTMTFMTTDTTIDVAAATANLFNESDNIHYPHAHVVNATHKLTTLTWHRTCLLMFFTSIIFITIFGNTLVILSVITTRRLRTVTNCFVMSLAVADWMVGVFVMPPAVLLYLYGSWQVGWILCDIWISLDILLCTASILSLCAISLDRYLAVTQPLHYKKRRTKRLALIMILVVWIVALSITCPPILGWYEPGRRKSTEVDCRYNQNKGYVIFSAMGSFFIPMTVMLYVYSRICCVLTSRHNSMARTEASEKTTNDEIDCDNMTSDFDSNQSPRRKCSTRKGGSIGSGVGSSSIGKIGSGINANTHTFRAQSQKSFEREESHHTLYELVEISKSSSTIRSSTITCKFAPCNALHQFKPIQSVQFCQSQTSISETSSKMRIHGDGGKRMPIRISSLKRETKAAQTLSIVVGGFIACWLPFFIYYLLIPFLPKESVSEDLMVTLTWGGWLNSTVNPAIYAFYSADFRAAFWRLTLRKCWKSQNSSSSFKP